MASSTIACNFSCNYHPSIPLQTSATPFSLSFSHPLLCSYNGLSLHSSTSTFRVFAKFEKFQTESPEPDPPSLLEENTVTSVKDDEEDDSCLPSDLEGAVRQSGEAAGLFVSTGGMRATLRQLENAAMENAVYRAVELLIPQLQFLDDEGAQVELWDLSRIFLDTLIEKTKFQRVKAIFPDAGAAALLKFRWKDAIFRFASMYKILTFALHIAAKVLVGYAFVVPSITFQFFCYLSSLSDRKPVEGDDEIVVMIVPDYQMLEYVERIASNLSNDPPRPLIMWNPRLISEDVGVGFNVRKLRRFFLRQWKVFSDDKDRPNRYLLAKDFESRPDAEDIEILFAEEEQKSEQGQGLLDKAAGIFSSISRMMKSI
ncbi:hypothetical protein V8G54_028776 [Vigna mungo]|uniref:DUF1995 domain-containing protein n=1 Tax=Vigna mungo TaxID=3915 RepID=A0AAQ3RM01_VIGMU